MIVYIEAVYEGAERLGYQYGHAYPLEVEQRWAGRITVVAVHGFDYKPIGGTERTYADLGEFLHEWKTIRVLTSQFL